MGQWFSWVKSNEKELLVILDGLAKKAVEASEVVYELLQDPTNVEKIKDVSRIETEADVLTRDIFSELNRTFITPLDREDMQRVASKIDDIIVSNLSNVKNPKSMIEHCRNTSVIEHKIDDLYRTAITELFESNDAIHIIKLKDIYETMETASDRCVDVADVIEDIVLKYT